MIEIRDTLPGEVVGYFVTQGRFNKIKSPRLQVTIVDLSELGFDDEFGVICYDQTSVDEMIGQHMRKPKGQKTDYQYERFIHE